jgi:uncharacterized phage protein (TIGR02220 family)
MILDRNGVELTVRLQGIIDSLESDIDKEFLNNLYSEYLNEVDDADFYRFRYSMAKKYIESGSNESFNLKDFHKFIDYRSVVDSEIYKMIE